MKYILVCDYTGDRESDPDKEFGGSEAVGPFETMEELLEWEQAHRSVTCCQHSACPIVEPSGSEAA